MVGLTLHCRFGSMLKMIFGNKVANVMLEFVDIFKVACRVDSVKVAKITLAHLKLLNLLWMINWEAAVWFYLWSDEIFENWCVSSYINWLFHLILSIALLFELLMYWWRNRWVESYWYKLFLREMLSSVVLKNCFSLNFVLFNVLTVSALLKIC